MNWPDVLSAEGEKGVGASGQGWVDACRGAWGAVLGAVCLSEQPSCVCFSRGPHGAASCQAPRPPHLPGSLRTSTLRVPNKVQTRDVGVEGLPWQDECRQGHVHAALVAHLGHVSQPHQRWTQPSGSPRRGEAHFGDNGGLFSMEEVTKWSGFGLYGGWEPSSLCGLPCRLGARWPQGPWGQAPPAPPS